MTSTSSLTLIEYIHAVPWFILAGIVANWFGLVFCGIAWWRARGELRAVARILKAWERRKQNS